MGPLLALDEICPLAAGDCCVPKGSTVSHVSSPLFYAFETSVLGPVHVFFQTIPPSVESPKRTLSSMTDEEPTNLQLLRVNTLERCLSTISFPSGLTGLNQPFPSEGYFPYYRTEGELCIDPALGDRFFTRREGLENKEEGQEEEPGIWSLSGSCLVC